MKLKMNQGGIRQRSVPGIKDRPSLLTAPLLLLLALTSGCGGLTGYQRVQQTQAAQPGAFTVVNAPCPTGTKILGGGFQTTGTSGDVTVVQSFPQSTSGGDSWQVGVTNQGTTPSNVTSWATCAQ